jgi:DNA-binding beta-propeller fold protein YncE
VVVAIAVMVLALLAPPARAVLPLAATGDLYVSMWTADEVRVFDEDGALVRTLTAPGLDGPRGIAFNPRNGDIWVAGEHSDALYVFDKHGRFLRTVEHPDFDEPVGITFADRPDVRGRGQVRHATQEVFVSNSGRQPANDGSIMVFDDRGTFLREFSNPNGVDPNCGAFLPDGTFFVSNRLGTVDENGALDGIRGRIDRFVDGEYAGSFTTAGISSLMAVARDPNGPGDADDTLWVTSGGGDRGIYEFSPDGELLTTILPADLATALDDPSASSIVPQGIAFDDAGNFVVASTTGVVYRFDRDGTPLGSFETGPGTARSIAYAPASLGHGNW